MVDLDRSLTHPGQPTVFAVPTVGDAYLITAGIINDTAKEAFTGGQCHAFAYALHQETGWPIVALVQANDWATFYDVNECIDPDTSRMSGPNLDEFADHLMCRRPDGMLVDITGARSPQDLFDYYDVEYPFPDPVWGVMPTRQADDGHEPGCVADCVGYHDPVHGYHDDYDDLVDMLAQETSARLVAVHPDDTAGLYNRRRAHEAAASLVPALLASLG